MEKKISNGKREIATIAITQILILVIATIAFSWMIGSEVKEVSADDSGCSSIGGTCISSVQLCSGTRQTGLCSVSTDQCCVPSPATSTTTCSGQCRLTCLSTETLTAGSFSNCIAPLSSCCVAKTATPNTPSSGGTGNVLTKATQIIATAGTLNTLSKTKLAQSVITKITGVKAPAVASNLKTLAPNVLAKAPSQAAKAAATNGYSLGQFLFGKASATGGWTGVGGPYIGGAIGAIVVWSAVAFVMGRYVFGPIFHLNAQQSQALGWSLAAGTAAGLILTSNALMGIIGASSVGGPVGLAIGAAVAFVMFAILYKKSSVDLIQYNCYQWQAPSGKGLTPTQMIDRCKMCNNQKDLPCTEYQCRSLGQGCVLINDASTGNQLCIWNNTRDILPPVIKPWKDALLPLSSTTKDFAYTPDSAIGPISKGVRIAYTGTQKVSTDGTAKCAPPFTPISFGVQLDEPATCKISPDNNATSYAEMADNFMGRGIMDYNQSFALSLPSAEAMAAENITVDNGGKYNMYVRCQDANGNSNVASFVFKFCISQGPDVTPPAMIGTSIINDTPIKYNQSRIPVELYVTDQTFTKANASCRWSHADKNYNAMEWNMSCGHSLLDMSAQLAYTCNATLTGLKDNQDNKIYFRCIDDLGNANTQSYLLDLIGTTPLTITSVGPTGTVEGPGDAVDVNITAETANGYDAGKAVCAFSPTGIAGSFIDFFYGYDVDPYSQSTHSQELGLGAGNYTYFLQCRDTGGNIAEKNISFSVKVDNSPPVIVRVYKDDSLNALKIITDETATCVYDNYDSTCSYLFDNGTAMNTNDGIEHYVDWNPALDFYIKCKDQYGHMPLTGCSLIARPFDIVQSQ